MHKKEAFVQSTFLPPAPMTADFPAGAVVTSSSSLRTAKPPREFADDSSSANSVGSLHDEEEEDEEDQQPHAGNVSRCCHYTEATKV